MKKTNEQFLKDSRYIHEEEFYDYIEEYKTNKEKIIMYCKVCGNLFKQSPSNHLQGRGCPKCSYMFKNKKNNNEFYLKNILIHDQEFYDYLTPYDGWNKKILIQCKWCGQIFSQTPESHLQGCGCNNCSKIISGFKKRISFESFKIRINKKYIFKDTIKNFEEDNKLLFYCNEHKITFNKKKNDILRGRGCPLCNYKKGEKFSAKYLTEHKIDFIPQYKFNDLKIAKRYLFFDFYIPSKNILIEIDGEGHRKPCFGKNKKDKLERFKKQKLYDNIKNEYCERKNIKLFRIEYNKSNLKDLKKQLDKIVNFLYDF